MLGGANSAGQATLHLARFAGRVTLVARATSLEVGMSRYLIPQLRAAVNVEVRLGTEIVGGGGDGWLTNLVLRDRATRVEETVAADDLFLAIGANPRTDWLPAAIARDDEGFVLTGADVPPEQWTLQRDPFLLETSMPGVLAVGDARYGSIKRVASAVGEGSVAIRVLDRLLDPAGTERTAPDVTESPV